MKNNKVYILVDEWTEPFWYDEKIFVFSTIEKAKEKMEKRRKDFLSHEDEDYIEIDKDTEKRRQDDDIILDMFIDEKIIDED